MHYTCNVLGESPLQRGFSLDPKINIFQRMTPMSKLMILIGINQASIVVMIEYPCFSMDGNPIPC